MSPRPYLKLALRWPMLLGIMYPMQTFFFFIIPNQNGLHFVGGHLLLPFTVGLMISTIVAEVLHRPFGQLLPGARRYFLKAQVIAVLLAAGPLVWLAHWRSPEFPLLASVGTVLAGLSMAMPWESYCKWYGSHRLAIGWFGFVGICAWRYAEVLAFARAWPWLVASSAVCAAVVCFRLGFSRERIRTQSMEHFVSPANAVFSRKLLLQNQRRVLARSTKTGRDWERAPIGNSSRAWMAALRFEVLGAIKHPWIYALITFGFLVVLALVIIGIFAATKSSWSTGFKGLYDAHFGVARGYPPLLIFPVFCLVYLILVNFPVPTRLYPASRQRLASLALLIALRQLLLTLFIFIVITIGLSGVLAWLADRPLVFARSPVYALPLIALPILPLLLWGALKSKLANGSANPVPMMIGISMVFGLLVPASLSFNWVFTPLGLTAVGVGTLATALFFVRSTKKLYLHSDLVGRASA